MLCLAGISLLTINNFLFEKNLSSFRHFSHHFSVSYYMLIVEIWMALILRSLIPITHRGRLLFNLLCYWIQEAFNLFCLINILQPFVGFNTFKSNWIPNYHYQTTPFSTVPPNNFSFLSERTLGYYWLRFSFWIFLSFFYLINDFFKSLLISTVKTVVKQAEYFPIFRRFCFRDGWLWLQLYWT